MATTAITAATTMAVLPESPAVAMAADTATTAIAHLKTTAALNVRTTTTAALNVRTTTTAARIVRSTTTATQSVR